MDSAPYDFVVVEQKYVDFSIFAHGVSVTYSLFPRLG